MKVNNYREATLSNESSPVRQSGTGDGDEREVESEKATLKDRARSSLRLTSEVQLPETSDLSNNNVSDEQKGLEHCIDGLAHCELKF